MTQPNDYFRRQLIHHILGGNAFKKIEDLLDEVTVEQIGVQIEGLPYTFWQQFEHMRITQKDILDFSTNTNYQELDWPKDYWPSDPAPKHPDEWKRSKAMFYKDREQILSLIRDGQNDLSKPFPQGEGQTLFREALLILEHNAYHIGEMMVISRLLKNESLLDK